MSTPRVLRAPVRDSIRSLGPFLGLALVVAIFLAMSGERAQFLSGANLRVVLTQTVIVGLGAIGMTVIIIAGGIDLSVGSVVALSSVTAAVALRASWPAAAALCAGVAVGGLVGLINGVAITRLRVVPFIGTLGMLGVARGAAKWVANEQTVNTPPTWLDDLATTRPLHAWMLVAPGVWITVFLALLAAVMLRRTVFGRRAVALGSNEAAVRACGIPTDRLKRQVYSLGGLFFGLAGVVQMSRLRQGDPTVAVGVELDVIAAVVIGGGSLSGGEGSVLGSMVGALTMAFLRNGCQLMGWPNYIQEIIIGVIIVLAVAADRWRAGRSKEL